MTSLYNHLSGIAPISTETWNSFSRLFKEITLEKGEYFVRAGEVADTIGFLKEGVIRAFYCNSEGLEYNKHFFVKNSFVGGYASLITSQPNKIEQQALTTCRLLVADYAAINQLYNAHHDLERIGRRLAELYFVDKEEREVQIVLLDADKRYKIFQEQFPELEQLIPQYHIASYLGITPTQLSRIRKKFTHQ